MKISVITVNYNNYAGLQLTIESVISQKRGAEYIIIDGGSTDNSTELLHKYDDQINYWVSERDRGVYDAMNKGIAQATGSHLIFLNSGDYFINETVLDVWYENMHKHRYIDIFYADTMIQDITGGQLVRHTHPHELSLLFLRNDTINHQASLIRANLFQQLGLYPEQYRLASDYWLYLLAFLEGKAFKYVDSALIFYDTHGVSAASGFQEYTNERKVIWRSLFAGGKYTHMLEQLIDELLENNKALNKQLSYTAIKLAAWLNTKLQKLK